MTRETKAGVVVSCSFLCLVGAVVYTKLRHAPQEAVAQAEPGMGAPSIPLPAPEANIPNKSEKDLPPLVPPPGAANAVPPAEAAPLPTAGGNSLLPVAAPLPERPAESVPVPPLPTPSPMTEVPPAPVPAGDKLPIPKSEGAPLTPPLPGPTGTEASVPPPLPGPGPEVKPMSVEAPKPDLPARSPLPAELMGPPAPVASPEPPLPASSVPLPPLPGSTLPVEPKPEEKNERPAPIPSPVAAAVPPLPTPAGTPLPPLGKESDSPPLPSGQPPALGKPERIGTPPPNAAEGVPPHSEFIPKGPAPGAEPPAAPMGPPAAPTTPLAPGDAEPPRAKLEPIRPMPIGTPMTGTSNPPAAAPPTSPVPMPLAPVGAPVTATTPPIRFPDQVPARPLPPTTPQVVTYDETARIVAAGDSFKAISRLYYGSEDYAQALQLWNQNHPRASDALARDGTLMPGDRVFLPPVTQLEKQYGALIPRLAAPASAVQTSFTSTAGAPAKPTGVYFKVVRPEYVDEIARLTLGSAERQADVLRLNPDLRANQPVAVGTRILLPPGARVPAENGIR